MPGSNVNADINMNMSKIISIVISVGLFSQCTTSQLQLVDNNDYR